MATSQQKTTDPSRVRKLIGMLVALKSYAQNSLAERSGVHPSSLSKYLNGEADLRSSSLIALLKELGVDVEQLLEAEINRAMGRPEKGQKRSIGAALEFILLESDPLVSRTILDSVLARCNPRESIAAVSALDELKKFKSSLKAVRRSS